MEESRFLELWMEVLFVIEVPTGRICVKRRGGNKMFCRNCGAENADDVRFCKECGQPLGDVTAEKAGLQKKNPSKKMLVGVSTVIIALIVILCIALNMGTTIDLDKYLTIEATGYDGYGTVSAAIDWYAIEEKYGDKLEYTSKAREEYGGLLNFETPVEYMEDTVTVEFDLPDGLSNGDSVAYTWITDDDLNEFLNCKVKYSGGTYTVSDLADVGTFDAFTNLEVTFEGVEPQGQATIQYNGTDLSTSDFHCDEKNGLSNGDVITVYINEGDMAYFAEDLGMIPEAMTKDYVVEGLDSYLSEISQITDSALTDMQNQAEDVYRAYAAQSWIDSSELKSMTYLGDYLLTAKDSSSAWGSKNALYLVYKIQARNWYSNDESSYDEINDIYWYIEYSDLMVASDGTVTVALTNYSTPKNSVTIDSGISLGWWSTQSWYYYGYTSVDDLYRDVVTSNLDSYNYEDNVDDTKAL
jgi:hypothetical protein